MSRTKILYTLDDGRILTMNELMKVSGISRKTLWVRLQSTRDYAMLSVPPTKQKIKRNMFKETYEDLPPKLIKLLFGKW